MSETLRDILIIAGISVVVLGLLGLLFVAYNSSSKFADAANEKLNNMTIAIEESDFTKYDGAIVSGSEVVSAIKYFEGTADVCVTVTTSKGTNNYVYTGPDLQTKSDLAVANTRNKTSEFYINPSSKFLGSVVRDSDGTITNIIFEVQ